jgi:AcrR family transcriptional regulator
MPASNRAARARSDEEKQQRETRIIEAAQALLLAGSFNDLNMSQVAEAAGLAKGTLYLYFQTKEALFLSVFERQMSDWFAAIESAFDRAGTRDHEAAAAILADSLIARPHLTRLLALSTVLLEHNISTERAYAHKIWLFGEVARVGAWLETRLGLPAGAGVTLLLRLSIFAIGLEGLAHPSPVSAAVYAQVPQLAKLDYRAELVALLRLTLDVLI